MVFRDSFEQCPRCGTTLEDAQAVRGCRSCAGMFVEQPMLAEMILRMLPPPPRALGPLALSEVKRSGTPLACPSCGDAMKPVTIHEVELDHCSKHGVWFDQDELRLTLYKAADPDNPPPFGEWMQPPEPWRAPKQPLPPPKIDPTARSLVWNVGGNEVITRQGVIKIGRMPNSPIRIEDEGVARMHAVVEVTSSEIILIDLGSQIGTFVNGKRTNKATLKVGDVLRIGDTNLALVAT